MCLLVQEDIKVATCTGDIRLVTLDGRGTQTISGPKPSQSRLLWLRSAAVNKHISGKLLSFFHQPAGRDLDRDYMGRLHEFPVSLVAPFDIAFGRFVAL